MTAAGLSALVNGIQTGPSTERLDVMSTLDTNIVIL